MWPFYTKGEKGGRQFTGDVSLLAELELELELLLGGGFLFVLH